MANDCTFPRALCVFAILLVSSFSVGAAEDYQLDPSFPRLPAGVKLGAVAGVADGRANCVMKMTLDGTILARWGSKGTGPGQFDMAHGITVGLDGAVYVGDINGKRIRKFVPSK